MTPEQFCYWLQGFFEITEEQPKLSPNQVLAIRDHLQLVFDKKTPDRKPPQWPSPWPQRRFNPPVWPTDTITHPMWPGPTMPEFPTPTNPLDKIVC